MRRESYLHVSICAFWLHPFTCICYNVDMMKLAIVKEKIESKNMCIYVILLKNLITAVFSLFEGYYIHVSVSFIVLYDSKIRAIRLQISFRVNLIFFDTF